MRKRLVFIPIILVVLASLTVYWYLTTQKDKPAAGALSGSGTVEATEVTISPEVFGRVAEVLVSEGDQVSAGDTLFRLDDSLLSTQLNQAEANLEAAQAGLDVAQAGYSAAMAGSAIAGTQYNLALAQALQQEQSMRANAWQQNELSQFEQPDWYFTHAEQIGAALGELNAAKAALDAEQPSFEEATSGGLLTQLYPIESRLAQARAAFLVARDVLDLANLQENQSLIDTAQEAYDSASNELDAAQNAYNDLFDSQQVTDILNARARLAAAQERYDTAQNRYNALLTGRDSLQVQIAIASLDQAGSNATLAGSKVSQAQAMLDQAQAAMDLIYIQMGMLVVYAPVPGVVLSRNIEPGEVVQPGAAAFSLGELDQLTITVYIPENRYGEVKLGDAAQVQVDSFPGLGFAATITRIADQAEFTPRNVQTVEGRSTTVYAVRLVVQDPQGLLKPGMPADVTFDQP